MSFPTPKFSKPYRTYAPRRLAPRPIVIPLYATPITRIPSPPLPVHRTLPAKIRFHPYAEARRASPNNRPPPISIPAAVNRSTTSPPASTESVPDSPLTPIDPSQPETSRAETVKIRPPRIMSVSHAGWHEAQQAEYREIAKTAIRANLDFMKSLGEQDKTARGKAIKVIEDALPIFKEHENNWGATILLRDQLKSMKDTTAKRTKRVQAKASKASTSQADA
ncbi:hypothetical protein E1B28_008210 [Marasmius oreades]|uniref:Uncharacterized protein n=1 Tax=Marasmius oreades TaxID=181124 RepID=A0A9P7RYK8_9AGAR|nr:uncharacterized protein E1B28_008210 [Marasmius oreades]KAG7091807.1 hypothetical protein E1B28_008210 [Marasmius oreades]